jgi:hypothetical protein
VVARSGWLMQETFAPYREWRLRFVVLAAGRMFLFASSDCGEVKSSLAVTASSRARAEPSLWPDPTYAHAFSVSNPHTTTVPAHNLAGLLLPAHNCMSTIVPAHNLSKFSGSLLP